MTHGRLGAGLLGICALVMAVAWQVPAAIAAPSGAIVGVPGVLDAVAFRTAQRGWVGGVGTILATPDGGRTWTRQYAGTATITQFSFVSNAVGWALATDTLLQTTDGGQTWLGVGEPTTPLTQIDFVSATQGWGIAAGTLYRTRDGGQTWLASHTPIKVSSVCFTGTSQGWIALPQSTGQAHAPVEATTNGGASWHPTALPPGTGGINVFMQQALGCAGPRTVWDLVNFGGYAGGVAYALYRSADGGGHWQVVAKNMAPPNASAPPGPGTAAGALAVVSSSAAYLSGVCYACGGYGTTATGGTTNSGRTWTNHDVPGLPTTTTALSFPTTSDGWLVAQWQIGPSQARSVVLETTDGGRNWQKRYPAPGGTASVTFTLALYGTVPSNAQFDIVGPAALGAGTGRAAFCSTMPGTKGTALFSCGGGTGMVYELSVLVAQGSTIHFAFQRTIGNGATPITFYSGTKPITGNTYIPAYYRFAG